METTNIHTKRNLFKNKVNTQQSQKWKTERKENISDNRRTPGLALLEDDISLTFLIS